MQNRSLVRRHAYTVVEALERKLLLSGSPLTSIPALNSDPGAPATLYLDFHGEAAFNMGFTPIPATPAYDIDGDPTTFSSQELANIQEIWSRVSEMYSPFNINVTTVDPGNWGYGGQHQLRALIGGNGAWAGGGLAGVAQVGSYASSGLGDTVFSFSSVMGGNPTDVADDIAHEAGHGFGLQHQSVYSGTTLVAEYNSGNSLVGPIMGVPFSSQRALWWDGPDIQGYNVIQDDMSVISGSANGFGYRPLTVGQSAGSASPLSISGGSISGSGIIEQTNQTDYYSFTTGAGTDTFNMNVAQYGAMLHAKLQLFDSSGNLVATAANASTLGQTLTATLSAGTYYIVAESYGQYGDVGQYTLSGSVVPAGTGPSNPTLTLSGAASVNEQATDKLSLSASDPGQTISSWSVNWGDGNVQTVSGNPSSVTHAYASGPNSYTISATATDGTGTHSAGDTVGVSVLHVPPSLSISGAGSVNEGSLYTLMLSGSDLHSILSWTINWGDGSSAQTISGNPSSVTHTYASGPNSYTVQASAADNVGTYSASNSVAVAVAHVPPTLAISGAASVNEQSTYTLNLSGSDLHTILSWSINWGDGTIQPVNGNPSSVTHAYSSGPNAYTILASATDNAGTYSAGNSVAVSVLHVPPTLSISGGSSVNQESPYTLNLSGSDLHAIVSWAINWGDGTAVQTISGNPSSVTHIYVAAPLNPTISATASDNVNTYNAANTVQLTVNAVPVSVALSGAATVSQGSPFSLTIGSVVDVGGTPSAFVIHWGDGSSDSESSTGTYGHVFNTAGTANISVDLIDQNGTHAGVGNLSVGVAAVPFTPSISGPSLVSVGDTYTLALSASEPANQTVSSWTINWGDGSAAQIFSGNPSSATHVFASAGPVIISASAINGQGPATANTVGVQVLGGPAFGISGASTVSAGSVYSLLLSASDPSHAVTGWSINWGDGNVQSISGNPASITHTYTAAATDVISATASDSSGSSYAAANTQSVTVLAVIPPDVTPPTASASLSAPTASGQSTYIFQIVYSDNVAIDASTLGNNNVVVTGPNGYAQAATLVSVDAAGNGATRTATYSITPPGGAWSPADGGTYTVSLNAGVVTDTSGNAVAAGALGSFQVAAPPSMGVLGPGARATSSGTLAPGGQSLSTLTLTQPLVVTFSMSAQRAGASVQITDGAGNVILSRTARQFSASVTMAPGTYNVAISFTGTLADKYALTVSTRAVAARVSAAAWVGQTTQNNYFFTLTQPESVTVTLSATGAVNVQLFDMNSNVLFNQAGAKFTGKLTLGPGSYRVQVGYAGQIVSRYLVSTANALVSAGRHKARLV